MQRTPCIRYTTAPNAATGYVSLEVSPFLAKDTDGTLKDARRLWAAVNRPNLMVKIPATLEGIPAIQQCISEGIILLSLCCLRKECTRR